MLDVQAYGGGVAGRAGAAGGGVGFGDGAGVEVAEIVARVVGDGHISAELDVLGSPSALDVDDVPHAVRTAAKAATAMTPTGARLRMPP